MLFLLPSGWAHRFSGQRSLHPLETKKRLGLNLFQIGWKSEFLGHFGLVSETAEQKRNLTIPAVPESWVAIFPHGIHPHVP